MCKYIHTYIHPKAPSISIRLAECQTSRLNAVCSLALYPQLSTSKICEYYVTLYYTRLCYTLLYSALLYSTVTYYTKQVVPINPLTAVDTMEGFGLGNTLLVLFLGPKGLQFEALSTVP